MAGLLPRHPYATVIVNRRVQKGDWVKQRKFTGPQTLASPATFSAGAKGVRSLRQAEHRTRCT